MTYSAFKLYIFIIQNNTEFFVCLYFQMEHSALQAELQKERQAKENALTQMQMATDRELENSELLQQVNTLQVCS